MHAREIDQRLEDIQLHVNEWQQRVKGNDRAGTPALSSSYDRIRSSRDLLAEVACSLDQDDYGEEEAAEKMKVWATSVFGRTLLVCEAVNC